MKLRNAYKYLIITIACLLCFSGALKAQINRAQIIGGYIYNFGNNINWTSNDFPDFKIVVISSNADIIEELTTMSENQRIQNKPISLSTFSKPDPAIQDAQLVFVTSDKLSYYMSVFDMIEGKEILLVSENFHNKSYVMLNLYDAEDERILFEINKPNILNQSLAMSEEMLLMSGTEIDIASIYLKSQHSLRDMEMQIASFTDELDSLKLDISVTNTYVENQRNLIRTQKSRIDSQRIVQEQYLLRTTEYEATIAEQIHLMQTDEVLLSHMEDSLGRTREELQNQNDEIQVSKEILSDQKIRIDSINNEITARNKVLSDKDDIISKQKDTMFLLWIIIFISILFVMLIFYAYQLNRKKSKRLKKQGLEIKRINIELGNNNEELKITLDEMQQMQQRLVQSEKMASLGILSAGIAHEINNPINFVYAGINSLLRDFKDIEPIIAEISKLKPGARDLHEKLVTIEQLKKDNYFEEAYEAIPEIIADIKLGADRTAEIIKGLRSFSRTDKRELKDLDIHEGIETSLLLLKNKYKKHVSIVKDFDNNISTIKCYPGKINQALLNIISNAIDSITENGTIWITTKMEDGNIIISVKDTGCGIDAEMKGKLFDPFYTTKPVGQGTGLGLSITYGIIQEHNGEIKVISEPDKGSEFVIVLPMQ
ncbi:MAG: DUF4154 domain-containing protein [Bacteroidetes bacterium]|jgi:signal transduction histidine kinase|nr:DUF4154 domain-containing protein [Bacteroidota bacterium]MBT7463338.1 DUF4154 domain-containing protein [Bacteroidota bacterium]